MSNKNRDRNVKEAEAPSAQSSQVEAVASETRGPNLIAFFHRNHPQNRASYVIPGQSGLIGVQRDLVVGTTPFTSNTDLAGMPATITLGVELVAPKADQSEAKAAAATLKAQEKADKAAAKAVAAAAKIEDRAAKAKLALETAQAKVDAAAPKPELVGV